CPLTLQLEWHDQISVRLHCTQHPTVTSPMSGFHSSLPLRFVSLHQPQKAQPLDGEVYIISVKGEATRELRGREEEVAETWEKERERNMREREEREA
uniref:Uncharacterized protein n=1 Tax=Periophthalmus magnuspinnatus TaxID=409849 RepID=A0A3B4ATX9_9GOBI